MGIGFIFFFFGLTVSAKEEDLQGFQTLQTESTNIIITMPSEEQNSSNDNSGRVSTESPALLTLALISSPGADLFHTPHESQHSSTVNVTTSTHQDAITSNGLSFILAYGTGSRSVDEDDAAEEPSQSRRDLSLISSDEGRLHPLAEAEFESVTNDSTMPAVHVSRGSEEISAFFHASLESKTQRVLESITTLPENGIPMASASDPAVIDNLGESDESVQRRGENKNENWTLESFRADDPQNLTEDSFLNKNHSTIKRFTVLKDTRLLTTELGRNPRNGSEHKENLLSPRALILDTPLQTNPLSQVIVHKMTESSGNPSTNGAKHFGVSLKHPDSMCFFSASKPTSTKIQESTTLNYFSNLATAAGEMHMTKRFMASWLITDFVHRIVSPRDEIESKSIFHSKSSKERTIKPALQISQTRFLDCLNKSDPFFATQNFSSQLETSDLCSKEARKSNSSETEKRKGMGNFLAWLSELMAFSTASFTNAEEATTANEKSVFTKQAQSSLGALPFRKDTSKRLNRFDELSTAVPLPPLTTLKNVFHVFQEKSHQPQRPPNHFPSERLKPFVSVQALESIPPPLTSAAVKRFRNVKDFTKSTSTNRNPHKDVSEKGSLVISKRPKMNSSRLMGYKTINATAVDTNMSLFRVQITNSKISTMKTFITRSSLANISISSYAVPLMSTTNPSVLPKLLPSSKKSNSEYSFLNHLLTTGNIALDNKQQDLKKPRGSVIAFFGSHTVSSIPSVQQLVETHPGEVFFTETPQSQSRLRMELYLKKSDGTVKPSTLKPHDQSSHSAVGMNQASLTSIPHKSVSHPIHISVSPIDQSSPEQHLTLSASLSESIKGAVMQKSEQDNHKKSHRIFVNPSDVKEHPENMTSSWISGISKHTTAAAQPEGASNTSPLESFAVTTFPSFVFQMQNVSHKENLTLTEDQAEVFPASNKHSHTPHSSSEVSRSSATNDVQEQPGTTALSAVTGEKLAPVVRTDFLNTNAQLLPIGSLQTRGGREEGSHGTSPFAERELERPTELVPDRPLINRRRRVISPDSLNGLAQISDDICGTGNYTAEMSLNLERDIMPGDLIPALGTLHVVISLKTNNSQVNLKIKSCCLSPTVRLDEFNTTCCIFSRLPIDPRGIRLLPSVLSKKASFTISLFQMINYSSAYLHCDLSVCLRNHSECEKCVQHRNAHLGGEAQAIFSSTGKRISFGPVLRGADNSSFSEAADDTEVMVVIMGSVAGCLLACLALLLVWMAHRRLLQRSKALCEC